MPTGAAVVFLTVCNLTIANCVQKGEPDNQLEEQILLEENDAKGRIKKTVITGRIPGEDIYLTVEKFDTAGRVIAKFGAKPYGVKYKSTFIYDNQGRIIEKIVYDFAGGQNFENYKSEYTSYSLSDTLANFDQVESKTRTVYEYRDDEGLTRELQ